MNPKHHKRTAAQERRATDRFIVDRFSDGWPIERILAAYPCMNRDEVETAIRQAVRPGGRQNGRDRMGR